MQKLQKIYAWFVHLFTSLGAVLGVIAIILSIEAAKAKVLGNIDLYYYDIKLSMFSIVAAVFVDSIDGSLARFVDIKKLAPIDGALLDNIIDFTTYSIIPCVWIYVSDVVSHQWLITMIVLITISSSYQFCQMNAKTDDNFFVGFPSYWNVIIVYMLCFQSPQWINEIIIPILAFLSFIPIKYIYLSRMENISNSKIVRAFTFAFTMLLICLSFIAIMIYPIKTPTPFIAIIELYIIFYIIFSIKLTIKPSKKQ